MTLHRPPVQTKGEAAYAALREAILDGRLTPGSRLRLHQLADDLGMSLTPVREALGLLQTQGLVSHDPHRGARVASLSREGIEEIFQLRQVLEPLACEWAARRATDVQLADISQVMRSFDEAVDEGRYDELPSLNATLHHQIYAAAGSQYLLEFIERLWDRIPYQAMSLVREHERSTAEHRAIVAALVQRKATEAGQQMKAHITNATAGTLHRYDSLLAEQPGPSS
ncbi:MAG TPA: GntR family transcriptional regulator [Segeticoccus sp.]|uniref:GntR family transcriptional regulator n=1 Tax=Segeticoccus sp. TaxID=2706531 RepID=UPI002D7E44B1|nr:GntR family transcriptional regulator [Segeticoccus sp.]HET8601490.1 GntR family transcriptional regulator [Segeticoccus sp.]